MIHAGNPVSLVYIIFIFALFWESRVEFASACSSDYSGWNSKRSVRWKSLLADAGVHLCQFLRCHCRQIISKFLHIVENEPSAVAVHCKVRSAWLHSDAIRFWCQSNVDGMSVEWNGLKQLASFFIGFMVMKCARQVWDGQEHWLASTCGCTAGLLWPWVMQGDIALQTE